LYQSRAVHPVSEFDKKSYSVQKTIKFQQKVKLQMEIEKMKEQIKNHCKENRIIDLENKLRDNKR